jgi:2-dehydropantoate 2-reductase
MRIGIIGAGGVGGYYGGLLARSGKDVRFLARGEHLATVRSTGLEVREPGASFVVPVFATDQTKELGPVDLVIVAVKSYSVAEVAPAIRLLATGGAVVLPLLNGVETFETLAESGVPEQQMLEGLTVISAVRVGPGIIERRSDFRQVVVGERRGGISRRAENVAAAFREAGADARVSAEIGVDLWRKFLFLTTLAAACGLARAPIGEVLSAPLGPLLVERAASEIGAVARARGVHLPEVEESQVLGKIAALPGSIKPSFLLDFERGGPTELEILSGAVSRLGKALGVPTPIHDTAVAALSR